MSKVVDKDVVAELDRWLATWSGLTDIKPVQRARDEIVALRGLLDVAGPELERAKKWRAEMEDSIRAETVRDGDLLRDVRAEALEDYKRR